MPHTAHPRRGPHTEASDGTEVQSSRDNRDWLWWVLVAAVIAVGTGLRLFTLTSSIGRMDGDEAVTGIMAQRIASGELFTFFAGQTYMGALEQYLQAAVLAFTPDTPTTLRVVQVLLTAVTCGLVAEVGRRMTRSVWWGAAAGALYAVGPFYNIEKGIRSHGAYDSAQLLAVLTLLCVVILAESPRHPRRVAALIGFLTGLAAWQSSLAILAVIPVVWWAMGIARGRLKQLLTPAIGGAALGALPFLAHRVMHGPFPPTGSGPAPDTTYAQRTDLLLDPVLGMFLGARAIISGQAVATWGPPAIITGIAIGALGAGIWSRRRQIVRLVALRPRSVGPIDVMLSAAIVMVIAYGVTDYTWYAAEPRYLFVLYPFAVLMAIGGAFALSPRVAPVAAVVIVGTTLALTLSAMSALRDLGGRFSESSGAPAYIEDIPPLINTLERGGVRAVRADYWLAYPIQFLAGGRLVATPVSGSRFPDLDEKVDAISPEKLAYVVTDGPAVARIDQAIASAGATSRVVRQGRIVAYVDVSPPMTPAQLGLP